MVNITDAWIVLIVLGLGSYALRFSFLGLIGNRPLPAWLLRHLRYTAVAILPGLVAPLVLFPEATGGTFDLPRAMAALATVAVGLWRRDVLMGILAGAITLYSGLWLTGAL